ncbi:MAG: hypothetical protein M1153_02065 [Patescibacteria group bacterium]|nr:hypothetical protein [Patescibacteria group bacterium]
MRDLFNNPKFYVTVIVILVVVVAFLAWHQFAGKTTYYAVYLSSGDIYFGQLSFFPSLTMTNAYLLQVNSQNQQNPYSLSSFSNAFWKPAGRIDLNRSRVLWIAPLASDSPVAQAIVNPQAFQQQSQPSSGTSTIPSVAPSGK